MAEEEEEDIPICKLEENVSLMYIKHHFFLFYECVNIMN